MAAPLSAAASANLGTVHRVCRNHRMGGASVAQIHVSAGLQSDQIGGTILEFLSRMCAAHVRLLRRLGPDRLVDTGLHLRYRPEGTRGGKAAYRAFVQSVFATAFRNAIPTRLFVGQ